MSGIQLQVRGSPERGYTGAVGRTFQTRKSQDGHTKTKDGSLREFLSEAVRATKRTMQPRIDGGTLTGINKIRLMMTNVDMQPWHKGKQSTVPGLTRHYLNSSKSQLELDDYLHLFEFPVIRYFSCRSNEVGSKSLNCSIFNNFSCSSILLFSIMY